MDYGIDYSYIYHNNISFWNWGMVYGITIRWMEEILHQLVYRLFPHNLMIYNLL